MCHCVSVLLLLSLVRTDAVAQNSMDLFSHSSAGRKSKMGLTGLMPGCGQHCVPSRGSRGLPQQILCFLAFSVF